MFEVGRKERRMRLIKADDVIKSLMDMTYYDDEGHTIHDYEDRLAIVKGFVDSVPTVDAVPVRHGKWFIGTVPYFVCSECKNRTPLRWDERRGYVLDYRSPYCPNCGAKMERKEE
jgi:hypothetical protein